MSRDGLERRLEHLRRDPVLVLRAFERDRHQFLAPHALADQLADRGLARRIEMADRVEAHHALRAQRAVGEIGHALAFRRRPRQAVPAEMPRCQLVGLQHALALAHREHAAEESELQRTPGRLAARPLVILLAQFVVVDVADRERPVALDATKHFLEVAARHGREPSTEPRLALHRAREEADVGGRDVGERVGPVFEHGSVDRLRLTQMLAPVIRNAGVENLVMAALDHVDGVDLHVAEMRDRGRRRLRARAERRFLIEPLRAEPDAARLSLRKGDRFGRHASDLEKSERFAARAGREAALPCSRRNVDDMHRAVALAADEQLIAPERHVHRLAADLRSRSAARRMDRSG